MRDTDVIDIVRSGPQAILAVLGDWLSAALGTGHLQTPDGKAVTGPGIAVKGRFYPVRTLTAEDADLMHEFLQDGLSEESRRLRFMAPTPAVPDSAAAWLADRDGQNRVALAALDPANPKRIIAVVEYASVPEGPPEVAVAVADKFQGKGIGSSLLSMLATLSLASGQSDWSCDILADNEGPLRLLERVGTVELGGVSGGIRSVRVHLDRDRLFGVQATA